MAGYVPAGRKLCGGIAEEMAGAGSATTLPSERLLPRTLRANSARSQALLGAAPPCALRRPQICSGERQMLKKCELLSLWKAGEQAGNPGLALPKIQGMFSAAASSQAL